MAWEIGSSNDDREDSAAAHPGKPLAVAEFGLCDPVYSGETETIEILTDNMAEYRKHLEIAFVICFSLNDYRTQMGEEGEGRFRQRLHGSTDLQGTPGFTVLEQEIRFV